MRFSTSLRLQHASQFRTVMRQGKSQRSGHFVAHFAAAQSGVGDAANLRKERELGANIRLGVVVGKRQARLAVLRNRVKRVCREAFCQHALQLPAGDLVLRLALPLQKSASPAALRNELSALFQRLSLRP